MLCARLGSDGYSTLVNGISLAGRVPYALASWSLGLTLVLLAWIRRVRPGIGTIVHPFVVGSTVDLVLHLGTPGWTVARIALLGTGAGVLALGVAVYLGAALGSGPFESAALALRPIPFRTAYMVLQAAGTAIGWLLGAAAGPGTLLIVFGVGPLVVMIRGRAGTRVRSTPGSPGRARPRRRRGCPPREPRRRNRISREL